MIDPVPDRTLADCAERFGFSRSAMQQLWAAVVEGGGDMAMFDHPEFAGPGQWMRGGLILITEPGNQVLKNRIDAACNTLSRVMRESWDVNTSDHRRIHAGARGWDTVRVEREVWWPHHLGEPDATGEQNAMAYAYFAAARRLAVRRAERVSLYDTGDHHITGLAQSQQQQAGEMVFTSQLGEVALADMVAVATPAASDPEPATEPTPGAGSSSAEILDALERLGQLQRQGVLTEAEFAAKKQELLARL